MKFIQSPIFWVFVLATIGIGFGIVARLALRCEPGFQDYVKNPELWSELEEAQRRVDREVDAASEWNDAQVAAAVRRFVFDVPSSREAWADARILESLDTRTHPALLQILRDSSLHGKLIKPTGQDILPESPFNRVCDLLDKKPPPEAVELLAPFLDESSSEIRKAAALTIGSAGTESIVSPIRKALLDTDEYVRSYALMGIGRAVEGQRLSDVCRSELVDDLQRLLTEGSNGNDAASLLLHLNEQQATEFFFSDAIFTPDSKALHDALRALNAKDLRTPRERVLSLIEDLMNYELEYPHTYQLSEALRSLGKHQIPDDRTILEKYLSHSEEIVAEGAAAGMLASHGLDGLRERIWRTTEERGLVALTVPQRRYNAVMEFDGEVNNGGLSQYFFNSSGDEWRAALAGLEAMESKERLAILREALAKFIAASPSENREARMKQLSKLARANDAVFDDLDSRYYECTEVVDVMATRYVLKNAEAFN